MKNVFNLLKPTTFLLLLFAAFSTVSCSKDEETPPDPRAKFVGSYEMNDFEIRFVGEGVNGPIDKTFVVTEHPKLKFIYGNKTEDNELKAKLKEFIETTVESFYLSYVGFPIPVEIEVDEHIFIEITKGQFVVRDYKSTGIVFINSSDNVTSVFNFEGTGKISNGQLTMDFEIVTTNKFGSNSFTGTATGERQK